MKKLLGLLILLVLVLSLAACGESAQPTETPTMAPTEAPLSDFERCAKYAVEKVKDTLKNPSSMIVNHLYGVIDEDAYIFSIDYTAENGFGGSGRDTTYMKVKASANSFSIITFGYGGRDFSSSENQMYTKQFYDEIAATGYYEFDTNTFRFK